MPSLVTVITATHNRPQELRRCVASVKAQTYPAIEHLVISDGPDPDPLITVQLAENHNDWGATPRYLGTQIARGSYIAYLDDDNEYRPEHIASLVELIEETTSWFVWSDDSRGIGNGRPELGHIDTSTLLHWVGLIKWANWRPAGYTADWDLVSRWLDVGAPWAYSGLKTVIYSRSHA